MTRPTRSTLLKSLTRPRLLEIAQSWELEGVSHSSKKPELVTRLARKRSIPVAELLEEFSRDELKKACRDLGLDDGGYALGDIRARLLEAMGGAAEDASETDAANTGQAYVHTDRAKQRPDVGVQSEFQVGRKAPRTWRYDSSLAPQLAWDENPGRDQAEWLLNLIERAGREGEADVFATEQIWRDTQESFRSIGDCVAALKRLSRPFLDWAGKAERRRLDVPTMPLFRHERHSTAAIIEALRSRHGRHTTGNLFGGTELDSARQLEAYEHDGPWENRMILGDSLQVMNSLLEYEGLGGQVQMIYMDPPYGVKFGSNFQPFVRRRDVAHGKDEHLTREPETIKAYRDTWELGLHSYLGYLRDRLMLAKELLTESGSMFVQISDENLHHVREVMDEVFGAENFVSQISFQTTSGFESKTLPTVGDFLLWYAKSKEKLKYNRLYQPQATILGEGNARWLLLPDKTYRGVTASEKRGDQEIPDGSRLYSSDYIQAQGSSGPQPFLFEDKMYNPSLNNHWKANYPKGMQRLADAGRLHVARNSLRYRRFVDDFPYQQLGNLWTDTLTGSFTNEKLYVVQTNVKISERCLLMTTDPGDLVLDPTCGSGTTAYVAEQWGRRWITMDTSRVPLALARQRLLTATFPWYELKDPRLGPKGGFLYRRKQNRKGEEVGGLVPRITLKSIANDEEPETVTLVDRPEQNRTVTRVTGLFVVEATIAAARSPEELPTADDGVREMRGSYDTARAWIDRMIEVLRRAEHLRLPGNRTVKLGRVRAVADGGQVHAEGEIENGKSNRAAICFGPRDGAVSPDLVTDAHRAAYTTGYDQLLIFGFAFDPAARDLAGKLKLPVSVVEVTPDVVMSDLLKTNKASEIFSVTGLPDILVESVDVNAGDEPRYRVTLRGLDVFFPDRLRDEEENALESTPGEAVPCWMLDTDYDASCFRAVQVFFPKTAAWDHLKRALKADFDPAVWDHLAGTVSEPFTAGDHGRIAVKVIDDRGNELMTVRALGE